MQRFCSAERLAKQLKTHAALEEDVLYPAVEGLDRQMTQWVDEARRVHRSIEVLVVRMLVNFTHKQVTLLRDAVARHMDDEEAWIFPRIDRLSPVRILELGLRINEYERAAAADTSAQADQRPR